MNFKPDLGTPQAILVCNYFNQDGGGKKKKKKKKRKKAVGTAANIECETVMNTTHWFSLYRKNKLN